MTDCPYKRLTHLLHKKRATNTFHTSNERSHYYEQPIVRPLHHVRTKEKIREDLQQVSFLHDYVPVSHNTHGDKLRYFDPYYGRFNMTLMPSSESWHRRHMRHLEKPLTPFTSVNASTYVMLKKPFVPYSYLSRTDLANNETRMLRTFNKNDFPDISANEVSSYKHFDPFCSTIQMTHVSFTADQRNGIARKDYITFYSEMKKGGKFSNPRRKTYQRLEANLSCSSDPGIYYPVSKMNPAVPHKGTKSTYTANFDYAENKFQRAISTNL